MDHAEAARAQYFEKAPQGFRLMALIAMWAIVINFWLIGGTTAIYGRHRLGGDATALHCHYPFQQPPPTHGAVVAFAWVLLIAEFIFELMRGVPTL